MTTALTTLRSSSWWKYWPVFVAAFFGPLLGSFLARWLRFEFAIGIASFVTWFFAALLLTRRSPPKWGWPRWLAAALVAAAAALAATLLAFFFPWK